jgi:hypothetical protein
MVGDIEHIKGTTRMMVEIEMPVTYVRGVERQITKNNMTMMNPRSGFPMRNRQLMEWYRLLELCQETTAGDEVVSWLKSIHDEYGRDNWIVEVKIFWYLKSNKTDCHNYNMILLDGLQKFTGVNDRLFRPNTVGMIKLSKTDAHEKTYAKIIMEAKRVDLWEEDSFMKEYQKGRRKE